MKAKIGILLTYLLLLTGCRSIHTEAEQYLEDKYGENFTFQSAYGGGTDASTKYSFTSDRLPGESITVRWLGENEFRDNYTGLKYQDQTRQLFRSMLTECYGADIFLIYDVNIMDIGYGTTFDEYKKDAILNFTAIVRCPLADKEEAVRKLEQVMTRELRHASATIYFDADVDLSKITIENYYASYLEKKTYEGRLYVSMSDTNGFKIVRWEDKK